MKTLSPRSFLVLLPLLLASSASAQWKNVAPNLILGANSAGAMQFRDGVVWAGANDVWSSRDMGITWKKSATFPTSVIKDIAFFNSKIGLIATDVGVLQSKNGGQSWANTPLSGHFSKVGFDPSGTELYALDVDGPFYASSDGGASWTSVNVGEQSRSFAVASDGTLYVTSSHPKNTPYLAEVLISSDHGSSWSAGGASTQGDCFTLSVDSCDVKRLYLVNENIQSPSDNTARMYLSTDGGGTWQTIHSQPVPYYSGSMTTTSDGIFLGTVGATGVLRSMDKGLTWKSIGGPADSTDTRNIAAVNDNIVLVTDPNGNVWRTMNGGGDSVASTSSGTFSIAPAALFSTDTLLCDSMTRGIRITRSGCPVPSVSSVAIAGPDSGSFRIASSTADSIFILLAPQRAGALSALLIIERSDGVTDTVLLQGYCKASNILSLISSSSNEKTDTIGGTVAVPIRINGLARAENVELVLHYPLADLEYAASFDPGGIKVDIPGEQWPGRSKLRIVNAKPGAIQAYSRFNVFSDTSYQPVVTFDSVNVLTALAPCEYLLPQAVTSTIIPLEGCGITMLSRWVHLRESPLFSIRPNPTSGAIALTSSQDVGEVWVEIYDMLGSLRGHIQTTLAKNIPALLSLPLESGMYYLRVVSQVSEENLRVIVSK